MKNFAKYIGFILVILILTMTASAQSNVMIVEAEDTSIIIQDGNWVKSRDDGLTSISSSNPGSTLTVDFFGTEFDISTKSVNGASISFKTDGILRRDIEVHNSGYEQIKLIEGLNNTYHTIEITVLEGSIYIDKVMMFSPTEIPELQLRHPDDYYIKASYNRPWIFQDNKNIYWISTEVQSLSHPGDIYIMNSSDGITWSRPVPVATGEVHEYDSATVVDEKGEFWMVFTRMEPAGNRMVNTPYFTRSNDGSIWDEPQKINLQQDNAYYPFLYYDAGSRSFIYLYASGNVEEGEYEDNIYLISTNNLSSPGISRKITDKSMRASYYPTIIKDDNSEYWLYFVSPLYENESIFKNHNDIFVIHSRDLINWSKPSLVTDGNTTNAYNYLHPAYRNGEYYLAIMSSQDGTEDAYFMKSNDGLNFTPPARMILRNNTNIIDYKSMTFDRNGMLWMVYSYVMDDGSRAIYSIKSQDGIVWSAPSRISPRSNISVSLLLENESESEKKTDDKKADTGAKAGFDTTFLILISLFSLTLRNKYLKNK